MYLGINAFFHDSGAALIDKDGRIIAAVQEERFSHVKKEGRFPLESIKYCLKKGGISINELDGIGFGWNPYLLLFQRVLWSNIFSVPASFSTIKENLKKIRSVWNIPKLLQEHFDADPQKLRIHYFRHHSCHVASAYYASPFERAAFLSMDGQGELEAITWGICREGKMVKFGQSYLPHSIGKVYSGTCRFLGFQGAEKDGTVMALAAFGEPKYLEVYRTIIKPVENKKSLKVHVNKRFFDFGSVAEVVRPSSFLQKTFGTPPRKFEESVEQIHKDIAASLQKRTEEVIIELLNRLHAITGETNLVLSGGVALNSVLNGKLEKISPFKNVFIQPAAHDAGLSLGAAYRLRALDQPQAKTHVPMTTAALGPEFTEEDYRMALDEAKLTYTKLNNLAQEVAKLIDAGKVIAWFQGRMEFGPRALGSRSLLGDARRADMTGLLNKVKHREKFRPFAISILEGKSPLILENITHSPFMLMIDTVKLEWRDKLPSAQHVDKSVRIQTVTKERDGLYYDLIKAFDELTGTPLIINTSLNVKGQPIVCSPKEAIRTFVESEIDILVLGSYIVKK